MLCSQAAKVVASRGFTRFKIKDSSSKGSERNQSLWIKKKKKVCGFFRAAWELPCGDVNVAKIVFPKLHAAMMVLICGRSRSRYGQPDNGIAR